MRTLKLSKLIYLIIPFVFLTTLSYSQKKQVHFKSIAKLNAWTFGQAYAYNNHRLYITGDYTSNLLNYEYETLFIYLFSKNSWEKIRFTSNYFKNIPSYISEFLPNENKIITIANPIQILDISNLRMVTLEVEGEYPLQCGSAVWKNSIYIFGGAWASNDKLGRINVFNSFTDRLMSFDMASFKELAHMPDERNTKGKFVNDKLYVMGGNSSKVEFNDILEYDPQTNEWKTIGHLPHSVSKYAITNDEQQIYIEGTFNGDGFLGIYKPSTNTYKEYTTNLTLQNGDLIIDENKLYFFAGSYPNTATKTSNVLYAFDLDRLPNVTEISCSDN